MIDRNPTNIMNNTLLFKINLPKEVRALMSAFDDLEIQHLKDSGDPFSLDTKIIMGKDVIHTVYNVEEIGKGQYCSFVAERLIIQQTSTLVILWKSKKIAELEWFIIVMYSRICTLSRVNGARNQLFTQGSATIENIPPTKAVIFQLVKSRLCVVISSCASSRSTQSWAMGMDCNWLGMEAILANVTSQS